MMPNVEEIEKYLSSIYQYEDENGEFSPFARRLSNALRHPLMGFAALRYVKTFPIVRVEVPADSPVRRWLLGPRRPWRHHGFISSYIELPLPLHQYWQGSSKQNLRTRTTQAKLAGFHVKAADSSEIIELIEQVFKDKGWDAREIVADLRKRSLRTTGESLVSVGVYDPDGRVVGFCVGTKSGNVVRTLWSCTSQKGTVRWLCFSGFVEEVSAKGASIVVESPPWAFTGGNKIFAGHLGFVPARMRSA